MMLACGAAGSYGSPEGACQVIAVEVSKEQGRERDTRAMPSPRQADDKAETISGVSSNS